MGEDIALQRIVISHAYSQASKIFQVLAPPLKRQNESKSPLCRSGKACDALSKDPPPETRKDSHAYPQT